MARPGVGPGGWVGAGLCPVPLTVSLPSSTSGQAGLEELPRNPQGHDPLPAEGAGRALFFGLGKGVGERGQDKTGTPCRRSTSLARPFQRWSSRMPSASTTPWPPAPVTTARGPTSSTCAQRTGESSSFRPREYPPPPAPPILLPPFVPGWPHSFPGHTLVQDCHFWTQTLGPGSTGLCCLPQEPGADAVLDHSHQCGGRHVLCTSLPSCC